MPYSGNISLQSESVPGRLSLRCILKKPSASVDCIMCCGNCTLLISIKGCGFIRKSGNFIFARNISAGKYTKHREKFDKFLTLLTLGHLSLKRFYSSLICQHVNEGLNSIPLLVSKKKPMIG